MLLTATVLIVVAFIALRILVAITSKTSAASGPLPDGLGPCQQTPNCVSSTDTRDRFMIEPLTFSEDSPLTIGDIHTRLSTKPRVTIESHDDTYLHATFRTGLMGYIDDVEFWAAPNTNRVEIRSASRIGKSDLGANRRRLEALRVSLQR